MVRYRISSHRIIRDDPLKGKIHKFLEIIMNQNNRFLKKHFLYALMLIIVIAPSLIIADQIPVITAQEELDLELFETTSPGGKTFFQLLDKTQTMIGRKTLKKILANPLRTKPELEQRQNVIKELTDPTLSDTISQELAQFHGHEHALYSLWQTQDPVQKAALEEFYFGIAALKKYNASPALLSALQVLNVGNMFGPLIEHALLHFFISNAVKEKYHIGCNHDHAHDHDHAHAGPASLLIYNVYNAAHFSFHLMGIKGIYDHIRQKAVVIKSMQESLISASHCVQSMHHLYRIAQKNPLMPGYMPYYDSVARLFDTPNELPIDDTSAQLIELLRSNTFQGQASVWSNIGKVLAAYHLMENAHALRAALEYVGEIDAHASIALLYTQNQDNYHPYTFAQFQAHSAPQVSMVNVWNPHLGSKCCTHSMELGTSMPNNSIITGDNAAGKSTMIKSMALAILLGQTFTIVPADLVQFTPFAKITTSIKHNDNIQAGTSLFITETLKAQALLDTLENKIGDSEFSFAIFDELFKSTSFEKGQKTAYELIEALGRHRNSLALIATHYAHLTGLQGKYPEVFKNYISQARMNENGMPIFELTPDKA